MVKYSSPDKRIVYPSFYGAPLSFKVVVVVVVVVVIIIIIIILLFLTFFIEKLSVSARVSKSNPRTVFTCVEKCYLSVVFAP